MLNNKPIPDYFRPGGLSGSAIFLLCDISCGCYLVVNLHAPHEVNAIQMLNLG